MPSGGAGPRSRRRERLQRRDDHAIEPQAGTDGSAKHDEIVVGGVLERLNNSTGMPPWKRQAELT